MPPIARTAQERAREALQRLNTDPSCRLPEVLKSQDVMPFMGRTWFMELLERNALPGIQVVTGGVWRCDRETFMQWLKEMA